MENGRHSLSRYERQMVFAPLGLSGQRRLGAGKALIVGVGGLGSWSSQLLARFGVGMLRLVDDDRVQIHNLHRQALYTEDDAEQSAYKVHIAARRLGKFNSEIAIEAVEARLTAENIEELAVGMDVILDGTDNFATRFIVNDYAIKAGVPWVFAGVVGAEGQMMPVVPGRTACLRCISDTPPPPCVDPSCRIAGVLGPAVAAIAAMQAMEAVKILSGNLDAVSPYLLKLDLWSNQYQRIDAREASRTVDCPCCKQRKFEYLEV